ncbi:sulfurtransferase [Bacillus thermotolerans]|uniref:Thiosulfate sulfurtransferase, rhodanese n=1 Tax=Bacillus thermotolerans TaxID=1221996 RepID=A0A0F5I8P0_BACTR|nr:sulfurtransferase [Bacillus thermotolerans]KKB41484.1 Thiosulfate sulfurtransferase, rhodanese [Bacillus thermotolerans]KKB41532.1 Thiosulfate sulfurtransferase, rhodanese [Bacillus thermotolerans]
MSQVPLIVTTDWLAERLDDPKLRLVDATTFLKIPESGGYYDVWSGKEAYEKGHIPGAVFADLLNDFSDPDSKFSFTVPPREQFVKKAEELGIGGEDTYVVVYDQGAMVDSPIVASDWASRFAWQLRYEGFGHVAVLDGGFPKWMDEGRPVTTEPGSYPRAEFSGERRPDMLATIEDVKAAMTDENVVLINSLSEADFKGETDTYERSGHIPGSVNVFFGDHSDPETKELYSDEKLRETFEKAGALDPKKKVITYCGSGIAATWNALLLNKLGQNNVAMYDGSMTEWTSDPSLPLDKIARGVEE